MPDGARKIDPKSDPRRRCRKLGEWPEADRAAWGAAVAEGDLLEGGGPAAGWRATTRKAVQDAYGRWLTFLALNGWLDPDAGPADRLTPERLRASSPSSSGRSRQSTCATGSRTSPRRCGSWRPALTSPGFGALAPG